MKKYACKNEYRLKRSLTRTGCKGLYKYCTSASVLEWYKGKSYAHMKYIISK